jgi:PIN domain nuclease of toxin-antitoxin system
VTSVVLDASALIALLRDEPGADVVRQRVAGSLISAVNYSEVLKKTIEVGGMPDLVHAHVGTLTVNVVPFDELQARSAAALYPATKRFGLSFADRACLSLGMSSGALVLTAEAKWRHVELPVKLKVIRGKH